MWPATMAARDPTARAAYETCPTPRVLVGEYGCTASHVALMEHALESDPELLHPASNRWVLVFEDDAQPQRPDADVVARIQSALDAATRLRLDAVFLGWLFLQKPAPVSRVDATLWRARAPILAHAYALRGSALPGVLALLKQLHCTMPVDCVYVNHLRDVLLATHARDAVPVINVSHDALFRQLATPSSIGEANKPRTPTYGATKKARTRRRA
jgi:GR25 family glycosyltransferase involved in LPS biosynthesis